MHLRPRTALTLCIPLRGNSHFASSPVPPSRCIISAARTVRWHSPYPSRMTVQYGDQTVCEQVCCVSRPLATGASSPPLPSPPVSSHPQRLLPRILHMFASDLAACSAHASSFFATYQQTPELPENHPTIVGSVWEQEIVFSSDAILFFTAVAVAQCLAASALFSRF